MAVSTELAAIMAAGGSAAITAVGAGQWRRVKSQNNLDEADVRHRDIESAVMLNEAYRLLVGELRSQMQELREENRLLRDRVVALETLLRERTTPKEGKE